MHDDKILAASLTHPIVPLPKDQLYRYGTAGFRMNADLLDGVTFRVGLLASLRSRKMLGQPVGVMITASHNPAVDNGVKIVDPTGEMLDPDWEKYATSLVNASSDEELVKIYNKLAADLKVTLSNSAKVIYGRDTRPSGHKLATALSDALVATDTEPVDYKILTTPQLHYLTRASTYEGTPNAYGKASEEGYYEKLATAFVRAMKNKKIEGSLVVDCANGVGGPKLTEFLKHIPKDQVAFDVKVVNDDVLRPEVLNLDVSAYWTILRGAFSDDLSAAPITSKPNRELRHLLNLRLAFDAARSTATLTVLCTTGWTLRLGLSCWTATVFRLWPLRSLASLLRAPA